jgi:hypothetical protein
MSRIIQECRSNDGWQPIEVQSKSDHDVRHLVLCASWVAPREYICDCKGYQFRAKCSHQLDAAKLFCRWTELDGPETQTDAQKRARVCPRCEGPTHKIMED